MAHHPTWLNQTPVEPDPGVNIPAQMCRNMVLDEVYGFEEQRGIPHRNLDNWDYGRLQRYRNYVGFWGAGVRTPGPLWEDDNGAQASTL